MKTINLATICRARRGLAPLNHRRALWPAPLNHRRALWPAALACLVLWITLALIAAAALLS